MVYFLFTVICANKLCKYTQRAILFCMCIWCWWNKSPFLQFLSYISMSVMCCTSTREGNVCHYSPLQTWFSSKLLVLLLNKYVCKIMCVYIITKDCYLHKPIQILRYSWHSKYFLREGAAVDLLFSSAHTTSRTRDPQCTAETKPAFFPLNHQHPSEVPRHPQLSLGRDKIQLRSEYPLEVPSPLPWLWKQTGLLISTRVGKSEKECFHSHELGLEIWLTPLTLALEEIISPNIKR